MKTIVLFLFAGSLLLLGSPLAAQSVESLPVEQFMERYQQSEGDEVYVYNFWATWCGPCVKELPYFEAVHQDTSQQAPKVFLVSLDFDDSESLLDRFAEKKAITAPILYLTNWMGDGDWIGEVEEKWTGAIPITILHHPASGKRAVWLKEFANEEELRKWIHTFQEQI